MAVKFLQFRRVRHVKSFKPLISAPDRYKLRVVRQVKPCEKFTVICIAVDPETLFSKDSILETELSALLPDGYPEDAERLKKDLNRFLGTIDPRDRRIFIRRYYFLEDPTEIGEEYGVRASHVRTILTRTRKKLKKYLKEEYA